MNATRQSVLSLYRSLLRTASQFTDFNFRMYARRRVRTQFRENVGLQDAGQLRNLFTFGRDQLAMLRRQTAISNMYPEMKSVLNDYR